MAPTLNFFIASALLTVLLAETWIKRRTIEWALQAALIYVTTFAWYFVDPFIHPESYDFIPDRFISLSYLQVIIFLVGFRILVPKFVKYIASGSEVIFKQSRSIAPETLQGLLVVLWLGLFVLGYALMEEGSTLFDAFLPLDSRAEGTKLLWARGAAGDAGPLGFVISAGGYIYLLVCGLFGVMIVFQRSPALKALNVGLVLLTWPYFLLCGNRSQFLAVSMPAAVAYLVFGRQWLAMRVTVGVVAFMITQSTFLIVGAYRGVGFRNFFDVNGTTQALSEEELTHNGLNMIQELCFVNVYYLSGVSGLGYGKSYFFDVLNVVPRVIWPNKPMLGIDYAVWRGFGGASNDIGVVATISTGFIGGGILNFGPYFGPLAPAVLLSTWAGLLARWWRQRASLLRACLFLASLGLTFNLGRDITLLVLWPAIFAYLFTRLVEACTRLPQATARPSVPGGLSAKRLLPHAR